MLLRPASSLVSAGNHVVVIRRILVCVLVSDGVLRLPTVAPKSILRAEAKSSDLTAQQQLVQGIIVHKLHRVLGSPVI